MPCMPGGAALASSMPMLESVSMVCRDDGTIPHMCHLDCLDSRPDTASPSATEASSSTAGNDIGPKLRADKFAGPLRSLPSPKGQRRRQLHRGIASGPPSVELTGLNRLATACRPGSQPCRAVGSYAPGHGAGLVPSGPPAAVRPAVDDAVRQQQPPKGTDALSRPLQCASACGPCTSLASLAETQACPARAAAAAAAAQSAEAPAYPVPTCMLHRRRKRCRRRVVSALAV